MSDDFNQLIANAIAALEAVVKHEDFLEILLEWDSDIGVSDCHRCLESLAEAHKQYSLNNDKEEEDGKS